MLSGAGGTVTIGSIPSVREFSCECIYGFSMLGERYRAEKFAHGEETLMTPDVSEARAQFETWARDYDRVFWSSTF